jgi:uncharacterized RDD family membrane protein YckC
LATFGPRVAAYLLDSLFTAPPAIIAGILFAVTSKPAELRIDPQTGSATISGGGVSTAGLLIALVLYLATLGLVIYNRWIMQGRTGQSWGKQVMKLRLLGEETGQPIGGGMAFVRDLAHLLDALPCYVGYLFPIWDPKRQTFADKILKTVVINEG